MARPSVTKSFWTAAGIPQGGSHAALEALSSIEKRCRRCTLPPQSKILPCRIWPKRFLAFFSQPVLFYTHDKESNRIASRLGPNRSLAEYLLDGIARMSDPAPDQQSKPERRRIGGPPKPPIKTTLDLQDESEKPSPEDSPTIQMVTTVTNATVSYAKLLILNGGGRPQKRESLELSLDRNIILLAKLIPQIRGEDLEIVTRTLRDIRDYRRHHPRSDASNREQAEQAQKVLDEIR